MQEVVGSTWRKENELKDLKIELAALDRKIQLSLTPIDTSENETKKAEIPERQIPQVVNGSSVLNYTSDINSPKDYFKTQLPHHPENEHLMEAKAAMGDRLIIASIPNYHTENQPKGIKI